MTKEEADKIKGNIWELDTVEIRWVLRWLNNNIKRVIEPSTLAAAKHTVCHKAIIDNFDAESMARAHGALLVHQNVEANPNAEPTVTVSVPGDASIDQRTEALKAYTDKAPKYYKPGVADPMTSSITDLVRGVVADMMSSQNSKFDSLAKTIALVLNEKFTVMTKRLTEVEDALMAANSTNLTITFPDMSEQVLGTVHKQQAVLIKYLAAGCHVFLTGPAGSGKSTAGEKAAQALNLSFGAVSCCSQDTVTKFLGYMDAAGVYHTTEFREAYSKGGVFVIDEMDAGNPNVLAVLNSALSNSVCAFPDGMVKRHDNFKVIATGNTWGTGKTIQYVGRNAIDAATLNRFVVIYWDYDEALEAKIAGMPAWSKFVQQCRAEIKRRGINFLITPRASIFGARALKAGIPLDDVIDNVLFPNLDPDIKKQMPAKPAITEIK